MATEVQEVTQGGEFERQVKEFWFTAPSSWRLVCIQCPSSYSQGTIIIGRKAWELRDGNWIRGDYESLQFPSVNLHALLTVQFEEGDFLLAFPGPSVDDETTVVLTVDLGDYSDVLTEGLDNEDLAASIREGFRGVKAKARYVKGTETNRLYEFELTAEGPEFRLHSVTTVDYDAAVIISPPE